MQFFTFFDRFFCFSGASTTSSETKVNITFVFHCFSSYLSENDIEDFPEEIFKGLKNLLSV